MGSYDTVRFRYVVWDLMTQISLCCMGSYDMKSSLWCKVSYDIKSSLCCKGSYDIKSSLCCMGSYDIRVRHVVWDLMT